MSRPTVLMLLTNAYDPDPRVRQEALALVAMGWRVRIVAWDRDAEAPLARRWKGSRWSGSFCVPLTGAAPRKSSSMR